MEIYSEQSLLAIDGNCLSAGNKIIKNIGKPTDPEDCATKKYIDEAIENLHIQLKSINKRLNQTEFDTNKLKQNIETLIQKTNKQNKK